MRIRCCNLWEVKKGKNEEEGRRSRGTIRCDGGEGTSNDNNNNNNNNNNSNKKCNQSTTNKIYLFQEEATSERQEAIIKVAKGIDD